jgi:hypothetical protein
MLTFQETLDCKPNFAELHKAFAEWAQTLVITLRHVVAFCVFCTTNFSHLGHPQWVAFIFYLKQ